MMMMIIKITGETEQQQFWGMTWWSVVATHSLGQSRSTDVVSSDDCDDALEGNDDLNDYDGEVDLMVCGGYAMHSSGQS